MIKKYLSILADIETKINEGNYKPGRRLPSIRQAASHYGCSNSTILRAYAELENRHIIYPIAQSGYYVLEKPVGNKEEESSNIIDFSSGMPDPVVFPYQDFQHCINKAIDTYKHQLFTYGDPYGLQKLRVTLASHLAGDQVFAPQERIFVTPGIQQVLEILSKMPFPNGNHVILVEQPSYNVYLRYIELEGIPVCGILRTATGIDLEELEVKFRDGKIKFFYTMSRYQNPLGTTYSTDERKAISRLASKYNVYILEDDYMADLGIERSFDPIYSYSQSSHVIYLKSFSKIIFPGLRLGAIVLPEALVETYRMFQRYAGTSLLSQAALEIYMNNGMYERHKNRIASQYTERMRVLNEALQKHNTQGLVKTPDICSGIYAQFKLPLTVNLERLVERLAGKNIRVRSGKQFYLSDYLDREKFLRISISRARAEQINDGVKDIIEEVRKA